MTKSTITREQAQKIIVAADEVITALAGTNEDVHPDDSKKMCELWDDLNDRHAPPVVVRELARMALAAMGRESITVTDDMAYAFHHALTDSMIGADDVEEIKTGLRAVFANLTAPVVSAEYPDRLPCSVLLEPGLRFSKGIKTSTMLAALARRAVYESDMAALSSEERAEFQARIEDFKALIAQPAPVVSADLLHTAASAIEDLLEHTDPNTSYYSGVWADVPGKLRATMLQASPVCTCPSGDGSLRWPCPVHAGSSPVIPDGYVLVPKEPTEAMMLHNSGCQHHAWDDPDCAMRQTRRLIWSHMLAAAPQLPGSEPATVPGKWIPVSEQMPPSRHEVLVGRWWGEKPRWCCKWATYIPGHPDAQSSGWLIPGGSWTPTHWMPLPDGPQEVKDAHH